MNDHKYKLKWDMQYECGEFTKEELKADGKGGSDALMVISVIYPEDGSLSVQFVSKDGRTDEELNDNEIFKVWTMLSSRLAGSHVLGEEKRKLVNTAWESIRSFVLGTR